MSLRYAMKQSLRERVEELQAHKLFRPDRPKWLHKPKILQHVKEAELVSLSRDSDFAKIPAELQLHVISYLDYDSVLELKQTCRYFNYFVNADVIKESKAVQIEAYKEIERSNKLPANKLPCYTCLKLKATAEFYNKTSNYYYNAQLYSYNRQPTRTPADFNRYCIRCGFREGHYDPGTKLNTGGQSWMICSACGLLSKEPLNSNNGYYGVTCKPCTTEFNFMRGNGAVVRMLQWMIAVVILPLACTGKAMPWTSRANEHSLRWIFTVTLDLLTIGGTFASICARMQNNYGGYNHKRSENCKFVFAVEFTACTLWIAILASLFNEGHQRHWTGRYDRFAKGLTAMVFLESLLFVTTTLWANRYTRERLIRGTKRAVV